MSTQRAVEFKIGSESMFLCDMRPGFTEDGVECSLPLGTYLVAFAEPSTHRGRGFNLLLGGTLPDGREHAGFVDVDGARIGVFNRELFLDHFGGNFEDLFDWSDDESRSPADDIIKISPQDSARLTALVVDVQCDARYRIEYLKSGSKRVGVAVTPVQPDIAPGKVRQYTRVNVKLIGVGELWYYMDDWDFEPSIEDVIDSLIEDQVLYREFVNGRYVKSEDINPDAQLRQYVSKFRGVKQIAAFLESGQKKAKRIPLPESINATMLTADTTFREISEVVVSILRFARQNYQETA